MICFVNIVLQSAHISDAVLLPQVYKYLCLRGAQSRTLYLSERFGALH
jgi:hypothetical protein